MLELQTQMYAMEKQRNKSLFKSCRPKANRPNINVVLKNKTINSQYLSRQFLFKHPAVGVPAPHPSHDCPALSVQAAALSFALTHPLLLFNYPQLSFLNSLTLNWAELLFVWTIHRHVRTDILPAMESAAAR